MQSITMGTTNQAKVAQIAGALSLIGVEVRGVQDKSLLPEVIEDGATVAENARKKAIAYAQALGITVLSMDNALYLDGLPEEDQPGIHVRRINGEVRSSDDELLDHYQQVIHSLGGRIGGHWDFGVCVAEPDGRAWETVIRSPESLLVSEVGRQSLGIRSSRSKLIQRLACISRRCLRQSRPNFGNEQSALSCVDLSNQSGNRTVLGWLKRNPSQESTSVGSCFSFSKLHLFEVESSNRLYQPAQKN